VGSAKRVNILAIGRLAFAHQRFRPRRKLGIDVRNGEIFPRNRTQAPAVTCRMPGAAGVYGLL